MGRKSSATMMSSSSMTTPQQVPFPLTATPVPMMMFSFSFICKTFVRIEGLLILHSRMFYLVVSFYFLTPNESLYLGQFLFLLFINEKFVLVLEKNNIIKNQKR